MIPVTHKDVSTRIVVEKLDTYACPKCAAEMDVSELDPFVLVVCPKCRSEFTIPAKLGSFLLLGVLGSGGMGAVYHARDQELGREVAIKVMLQSVGDNKEFVETFRREAQAAAKLNHPHIAQIYSFGQVSGQPYIVMELVRGRDFGDMIAEEEPIDPDLVMEIGLSIAEGLSEGVEIGLIHGDIKPENILLDDRMQAKLIDFGIATVANQDGAQGIWGTPYYIAPEKVTRQRVDYRADIYSLGASLYHALAGNPPFDGSTPAEVVKARLDAPPQPLTEVRPGIDPQVEQIITRMLQPSPGDRYPTYKSLISDMNKYLKTRGPVSHEKKRSSKIVIRKAGRPVVIPKTTVQASPAEGGQEEKKKKAPTNWKAIGRTLLVLFLLAGVGAGIFFMKRARDMRLEERRERFELLQAKQHADSLHARIQRHATAALRMEEAVLDAFGIVTNSLHVVTGEEMTLPSAEPDPEPEPEPEPVAEPDAEPVAEPEPKPEPEEDGGPTPPGNDDGMPLPDSDEDGMPLPDADEAPEPPAKVKEPAPMAPPAPAAPEPEMPRIKRLALQAREETARAVKNFARAREILDQSAGMKTTVLNAHISPPAVKAVSDMRRLAVEIEDIERDSRAILTSLRNNADRIARMRADHERGVETRLARQREQERLAAIEAEKQRERERMAAQIAEERTRAETAHSAVRPLILRNQYRQAAEALRAQQANYQTEEGRAAINMYIERADRLHNLKLFLIDRLNNDTFRFGLGSGAMARDIQSADLNVITARGMSVTWEEVNVPQMLRFFRRYLTTDKVSVGELARQNLAAAIYCYENGGVEAARNFARAAVDFSSFVREDVNRLLPLDI